MRLLKLLWYSMCGLFRKPDTIRKVCTFAVTVYAIVITAHTLAGHIEIMILAFLLRWSWIPLSLSALICLYGEPIKRRNFNRFFRRKQFESCDNKIPKYIKTTSVNRYLESVRFKSGVHPKEWEKKKPLLEMHLNKKIHKFENLEGDMSVMDVSVIKENLPTYIEWQDDFMPEERRIFAIGEGYNGQVIWDAVSAPHGIVAGATGGGKTALLRLIIHQAINKKFNIQVFDFKGGGDYSGVEHMHRDYDPSFVISDPEETNNILLALLLEVKMRLESYKEAGVTNIDEYNALGRGRDVPWLIVFDEAAEIFDVKPKDKAEKELYTEIDKTLRKLARLSRVTGVHILMGFIRPSADVLDGQIKNNLTWRACGYFADSAASKIVLENDKATELPQDIKGRFIIGEDEVQAYYLPIPNAGRTD